MEARVSFWTLLQEQIKGLLETRQMYRTAIQVSLSLAKYVNEAECPKWKAFKTGISSLYHQHTLIIATYLGKASCTLLPGTSQQSFMHCLKSVVLKKIQIDVRDKLSTVTDLPYCRLLHCQAAAERAPVGFLSYLVLLPFSHYYKPFNLGCKLMQPEMSVSNCQNWGLINSFTMIKLQKAKLYVIQDPSMCMRTHVS